MSENSKIEWTDSSWSPVRGCTRVSEGCRNCYAERMAARFNKPGQPFHGFAENTPNGPRWTGKVELVQEKLSEPLHWRKPRRIFVDSMSDTFHEKLSFEDIAAVFGVMAACPRHTFQVLTKRPERAAKWFADPMTEHLVARAMDRALVQFRIGTMTEEWRPVVGHPGYDVSNTGKVRGPRGELSPDVGDNGYCRVTMHGTAGRARELVHRLVLTAFREAPRAGDEGCHLNGDRACNALPNLEWGSPGENWRDAKRHGSHRRYSKLSASDVEVIRKRAEGGDSAARIANDYPVSDTQIRNILTGAQWSTTSGLCWPLDNCWIGASVENQATADERIPHLLRIPARVRFLSVEPMLGAVDLHDHLWCLPNRQSRRNGIHWVIVGGESGPGARPMHPDWARSLRDQCKAAGVPFFFKQWGEWEPQEYAHDCFWRDQHGHLWDKWTDWPDGLSEGTAAGWTTGLDQGFLDDTVYHRVGKKAAGRLLDGIEHNQFPAVEAAK